MGYHKEVLQYPFKGTLGFFSLFRVEVGNFFLCCLPLMLCICVPGLGRWRWGTTSGWLRGCSGIRKSLMEFEVMLEGVVRLLGWYLPKSTLSMDIYHRHACL